jgi:hypothetical protein
VEDTELGEEMRRERSDEEGSEQKGVALQNLLG